jgi:hypothetical protein
MVFDGVMRAQLRCPKSPRAPALGRYLKIALPWKEIRTGFILKTHRPFDVNEMRRNFLWTQKNSNSIAVGVTILFLNP